MANHEGRQDEHSHDEGEASVSGAGSESEYEIKHHEHARQVQPLSWMAQSPLDLLGPLHDMPRHPEKHLPKFDLEKGTLVEDHIRNFYLSLQIMRVQTDDVTCRIFPHTLEKKMATWYRSLPNASIISWDQFRRIFLQIFSEDKTPSMLLMELSTIKCQKKEKVKYFNRLFSTILKKFPPNMALDDFITINYYTKALPRDIAVFLKHETRATFVANYATALAVEKDMISIWVIYHEG